MNVYIGEPVVVSDMQGPCPDGFHIPKDAEWTGLMSIMNSIGATAYNSYRIKLHLPYLGYRFYSNTTIDGSGEYGYYQSCNASSNGYRLAFRFSDVDYWSGNQYMSYGYGIRGFKNSFEKPNSSWTVIQGTIGGAGIFWNQADGIISITSNGNTGYTIMDKNLGATTVYNNGDTLSEANCGYYYQRGNNYGFAGIGGSNPSTSSSTVNVSTYGPGNYYKSSTWITSWNPYSSYNNNLRGGVSQGKSTKGVEVKNIYIGEYGWKPGANTIAYYPLKGSMVGKVGGTATLSNGTIGNDYVTLSSGGITAPLTQTLSASSPFTASIWLYPTYWNGNMRIYNDSNRFRAVIEGSYNTHKIAINWNYEGKGDYSYGTALSLNSWFNIIITYSGSGNTVYIYNNGTKYTYPRGFDTNNSVSSFLVGLGNEAFYGRVADLIVEKSQWNDQTCYDYYNLTKGNYGL